MATIIRVQGNRLELAIPLQTVTMTPNGKVTEDYNVPADAEVKVVLSSSWKTYGFEPLSISGNVVTMRDDGKLPVGKYAVEVRIRQADGTPLRSKYCNIIDIRDCNDGVTQEYDDFIEGSVTLDAQIFWFAKGDDGITPHIDETTGNWFIGDEDTGVHAQGEAGTTDYNELDNKPDLSIYVEKDGDKVLSDNNYTDEEKTKLAGLENYDDTNVLNLIEQTNQNFANYYTKQQTYSQSEVNQLLETQRQGQYVMVEELPEASADTQFKIYLVPSEDAEQGNIKDEYITIITDILVRPNSHAVEITYEWEKIGSTAVDLSGYSTTEEMNAAIQQALASYYTKTEADALLGGKQDTISDLSTIRSGAQAGATAYQKPAGGIPKTDLAQGVKDSLDKADSALQEDTLYEDANGHDYVEIAGMKWATKNIGANAVTDAGLYFQWGDIQGYTAEQVGTGEGQKAFTWADYKFSSDAQGTSMTKYNSTDGKTVLDLEDDAARANWGGSWRMPTAAEMQVFGNAVNAVWTNDYRGSGVAGLVCTDKTNNTKVVFFPAAGGCGRGIVRGVGSYGICWSSSLNSDSIEDSFQLDFNDVGADWSSEHTRFYGYSVRPILDTTQLKKDLDSKANDADLATVAKSGSYNDLSNKPTIPTVPTISTDIDTDGNDDTKTASPKAVKTFVEGKGYLTQHQDISGKANKSEMSVVDGTGANADKTTITLKNGTSATVLKSHQDISNFITKSVNDLVNYYLKSETYTKTEVQTLIGAVKQFTYEVVQTLPTATADTMHKIYLVPSSDPQTQNVKDEYITIDNGTSAETRYTWEQIGSTAIDLSGYVTTTALNTALADYTTTANLTTLLVGKQDKIDSSHKLSADLVDDTNTTNKFTNDTEKQTWNGKQDALVSGTNIKTINNESILGSGNITIQGGGGSQVQSDWNQSDNTAVDYIKNKPTIPVIPSNLAYTSNDNGEGIIPSDGIRAVTVTSAAAMTINPDVVTIIDGAVGTAAITLQVPQDNLAHVWDILMTTDSTVAITFAMSNSATILTPSGFSIGASKAVEISVIGVGTKYYLRYGEFA